MYIAAMHRHHGLKIRHAASIKAGTADETANAGGVAPLWVVRVPAAHLETAQGFAKRGERFASGAAFSADLAGFATINRAINDALARVPSGRR